MANDDDDDDWDPTLLSANTDNANINYIKNQHPLKNITKKTDAEARVESKKREKDSWNSAADRTTTEEEKEGVKAYLTTISEHHHCYNLKEKKATCCNCVRDVATHVQSLTDLVVAFGVMSSSDRRQFVASHIEKKMASSTTAQTIKKASKGVVIIGKRHFHLYFGGDESVMLCQNTFRSIFNVNGEKQWRNYTNDVKVKGSSMLPAHGNTGNVHRAMNSPLGASKPAVVDYLKRMKEEQGEVRATRLVREKTGLTTRDDEDDLVELPAHLSKRQVYKDFCFDRGWKVGTTAKGSYGHIEDYEAREVDDVLWPAGSEGLPVPSWKGFNDIWDEYFPNLKIRSATEDICGECYTLANRFRQARRSNGSDSDTDDDSDDGSVTPNCQRNEALIEEASKHVKQAKAMREMATDRIDKARADKANNVPFEQSQQTFIGDYAQNLGIPHVGANQPGDTYYYSPKTVYVFGCVDGSSDPSHLVALPYEEETGRKGSRNVASLVMKYLGVQGILRYNADGTPRRGKRLACIFDNCSGQNKNNTVLRLAVYLVECGFFHEVEIIFYIRGHTKNACDRTFNLMKKIYHKSQVWTYSMLCDVIGQQEDVTVVPIETSDFKDYEAMLSQFYNPLVSGTVLCNHVFRAQSSHVGEIVTQSDRDGPENRQKLATDKNIPSDQRASLLSSFELEEMEPPGLKEIKKVELYTKWRKFVPEQFQDIICPKPPDAVEQRVKDDRKERKRKREVEKQMAAAGVAGSSTTAL